MKLSTLEKDLQIPIKKNYKVIGLDTATRTGWCIITTKNKTIDLNFGYINIKVKDEYLRFNEIISIFDNLITKDLDKVIVEDTFFRFNPKMFRLISRIGGVAYTIAQMRNCNPEFLPPSTSRARLGFKGNSKKEDFQKEFLKRSKFKLDDIDIIDAIVLALNGIKDN